MFGLFSKKKKSLIVHDKIWISEKAKFDACLKLSKSEPNSLFVAWFEETKSHLQKYFQENNGNAEIYLADRLGLMQQDKNLIFVEHHPFQPEEHRLAAHLGKAEITVFSSLDEPLFKLFGGEKMMDMMRTMGVKEDEMIENQMIGNSIIKVQEKIATQSNINVSARSQEEWLATAGVKKL